MRLLPGHCSACGYFNLLELTTVGPEGASRCPCGSMARALPSGTYGADDRALFDEIAEALSSASLDGMTAARLVIELEGSVAPISKLSALKQRVPSLAIITKIAGCSPATARKASAMFETLLEAISRTHSRSDISALGPRACSPPAPRARRRA